MTLAAVSPTSALHLNVGITPIEKWQSLADRLGFAGEKGEEIADLLTAREPEREFHGDESEAGNAAVLSLSANGSVERSIIKLEVHSELRICEECVWKQCISFLCAIVVLIG